MTRVGHYDRQCQVGKSFIILVSPSTEDCSLSEAEKEQSSEPLGRGDGVQGAGQYT